MCSTTRCSDSRDRPAIPILSGDSRAVRHAPPLARFPGASVTNVDEGGEAFNGQSALYAVGGPRSTQFTLKVIF
jgi:hypothetical protein